MTKEERKEVITDIFRMLDKLEELHTQELSEQFPSIPEEEIREVVHWRVEKNVCDFIESYKSVRSHEES